MNKAMFQGKPDGFDVDKAFEDSFAGVVKVSDDDFGGQSTEYYNPFHKINQAENVKNSMIAKIDTQTGGAGTAGTALIPVWVDTNIIDRTVRELPLRSLIPRRAVKGMTYDYNAKTVQAGASWEYENAAIADQTDTYNRVSVGIKFLYAKGKISSPSIAAMRGYVDPTQLDLASKTKAIYEAEEDMILNGDASTNPEEPTGLITGITTNTTNLSGVYPTLTGIRAELATTYNANGMVTLAVTDANTHNYIKGLLLDIQRNVENPSQSMLGFGIPGAFEFDGVMFIRDRYMPTTTTSRRILFLDMRYIFLAVLQDLTYEEKPTQDDAYVFMLKEYMTFVNTFEASCSQIYGVK